MNIWLLAQSELSGFLASLMTGHGHVVQVFDDPSELFIHLSPSDSPEVIVSEDPPPLLPRISVEGRIRDLAPHTSCIFVRDDSGERTTADAWRFVSDDFSMSAGELLELLDRYSGDVVDPVSSGVADAPDKIKRSLFSTISTFVRLLERYEFLNGGNGPQVQHIAVAVARQLGLPDEQVDSVAAASLLYDVGMMRVRPEIKLKSSVLSEDDRRIVRRHVHDSAEFCKSLHLPWDVTSFVLHHHERFDGSGYPDRLAGQAIPLGARIIAVGDAYFAMLAKRPQRAPFSEQEALSELQRNKGLQFDPEIVDVWSELVQMSSSTAGAFEGHATPRVALLDDDQELRFMLEEQFATLEYRLAALEDSKNPLQAMVDVRPQAILLSVDLGWADAFQLLHQARQEPGLGGVPIILTTTRKDAAERSRAVAHGADDFIVRPCAIDELVARVTGAIRKKQRLTEQHFVRSSTASGIKGSLEDMGLVEICQILAQGFKTARVRVVDEESGDLFFTGGKLCHATFGELEGPEAFYALLGLEQGQFTIEHGIDAPSETIAERLDHLLMEGMRLLDEQRRDDAAADVF